LFVTVVLNGQLDSGKRLSAIIGNRHPEETRRLVVMTGNVPRPPSTEVLWQTDSQLDPSPEVSKQVEQWLRAKEHRTTLSQSAFMHLFEAAALDFDRTRAIETCLFNLKTHPVFRPGQMGRLIPHGWALIMEMLADLTVTQENRELLQAISDDRTFQFEGARQALPGLADAWLRLGEMEKARAFYEQAGLNKTEIASKVDKPMLRNGALKGILQIEGRPVAGAQVGLVSTLRWLELVPPSASPNAFSLRVICAGTRTDSEGRFELDGVPTGEYFLVAAFTPKQIRPSDEVLVNPQPGVIRIGPARSYDFGVMQVKPVAPKPSGRKERTV
jgi:hypothetical protein